jgi:serine/threonine-protein kinase
MTVRSPHEIEQGQRKHFIGRYRLIAELGRGGMANVYLALTEGMGGTFSKLVVLKTLREFLTSDPEFVTMFLDEARIAARMNHPNVVQTLEAGHDTAEIYLAMEYLDGQSLSRVLLRDKGTITLAMRIAALDDVLAGLHYAHELADFDGTPLHIVHRDVTPHNVFVTYDGEVKVVDFGIAQAEGRASRTRHGVIKGKVSYMSPEQARSEVVDRRTDVFAVGIMLAESLAGERFWGNRTDKEILRALVGGAIPDAFKRASVPDRRIVEVCARALAADPAHRYPTALAMQEALEPCLAALGGRPSRRAIGSAVAELFEDRRKLTKQILEQQLADLSHTSVSGVTGPISAVLATSERLMTELDEVIGTDQDKTPAMGSFATRVGGPSDDLLEALREQENVERAAEIATVRPGRADADAPSSPASPRPSYARRGALLLALGVALVIPVGVGAAYVLRSYTVGATDEAPVRVSLRATPSEARFQIDDGPELPNPYIGQFARDGVEHRIVARIPGRAIAKEHRVRFDEDVSLQVLLKP